MDRLERARAWVKFPGTWSEFLKAIGEDAASKAVKRSQRWQRNHAEKYNDYQKEKRERHHKNRERSGVVQFKRSIKNGA